MAFSTIWSVVYDALCQIGRLVPVYNAHLYFSIPEFFDGLVGLTRPYTTATLSA